MKKLHLVSLLVCMLLMVVGIPAAIAQEKTITGKITDASGQPVAGATVTAKGTQTATQSNSQGNFSIAVPNSVQRLVVSSVGFAPQDIAINGQSSLSVALAAAASELSEVIVTALGVERNKKSLQFSSHK
ncbi:MAG: carboxypeptidase-like regulatory domain-containing protein [Ferruginibacter sp.]